MPKLNQTGYISSTSFIFFTLLAILAYVIVPKDFKVSPVSITPSAISPTNTVTPGSCQTIPQDPGPPIELLGVGSKKTTNFIKIRTNIPINKKFYPKDQDYILKEKDKVINGQTYDLYYPAKLGAAGEICYPKKIPSKYRHPSDGPEKCNKRQGGGWKVYFADFGIIFAVLKGPDGLPITSQGLDELSQPETFWLSELYQQESEYAANHRIPDDLLACPGTTATPTSTSTSAPIPTSTPASRIKVSLPDQASSSTKQQLQLQYFDFSGNISRAPTQVQANSTPSGWSPHCKPAIYLYPKEKMSVNVKVNTKGEFLYTNPKYPDSGWTVMANPDGKIESPTNIDSFGKVRAKNSFIYNYLYYESRVPDELIEIPKTGLTVSFNELSTLYQTLLPKLGLNETQVKDFVDYWEKALPYSPYYFVGVMSQENINYIEPLEVTPKPDSINRVRLYFKALDKKPLGDLGFKIDDLRIFTTNHQLPTTNQFKITEWGGMVKRDLLHPFTCSQ